LVAAIRRTVAAAVAVARLEARRPACGEARVNSERVAYACRLPPGHDGDHHPNPCGHDGCTGLECLRETPLAHAYGPRCTTGHCSACGGWHCMACIRPGASSPAALWDCPGPALRAMRDFAEHGSVVALNRLSPRASGPLAGATVSAAGKRDPVDDALDAPVEMVVCPGRPEPHPRGYLCHDPQSAPETPAPEAGRPCVECKGRGWHPGDCHPSETCGVCDGSGFAPAAAPPTTPAPRCKACNDTGTVLDESWGVHRIRTCRDCAVPAAPSAEGTATP
jgi:hypothetical protein